jgi:hypothetical protein
VPIPPVGTKPPPKAGSRLRPMSSLEPRGPSIVPREPVPAPAAVPTAWRIPGAILSPAACAAADKYIAERESTRARGLDVPKHARYRADAGPLAYAGTRNVDGQTLALLQCGDELLVMPIDPVTATRLRKVALGQVARVTANGSITTGIGRGRSL